MLLRMRLQLPDGPPIVGRRSGGEMWCVRLWFGWIFLYLGLMSAQLLWQPFGKDFPGQLAIASMMSMPLILAAFLVMMMRARRRLRACRLLMCPACWHPMVGEAESDFVHCPECGARAAESFVRGWWEGTYRIKLSQQRTADA